MIRIAVVGSREFFDYEFMKRHLDYFLQNIKDDITIVSGGAKGTDSLAAKYAKEKGYKLVEYLPEYDKFPNNPKAAPLARNLTIMQNSDMAVAFSKGYGGTENAIGHARDLKLPIRIVKI